jgi:hypothetical protein
VAEEAKGQFKGVLVSDPDRQAAAAAGFLEQDDVVVLAGVGDTADVAHPHVEEVSVGGGWHDGLLRGPASATWLVARCYRYQGGGEGEAGSPVTVVSLPGRRAGLEGVEKSS